MNEVNNDPSAEKALAPLAEDKAPTNVAQLVIWHIADGFEWDTIAQFSRGWANAQELTLARQFAEDSAAPMDWVRHRSRRRPSTGS